MGVRSAARTLRAKTINKPVRVQLKFRIRNRLRRPLSRTSRHLTRIPRIQPARQLSKPRVLPNRARSGVISVARVVMSPPLAARTLAVRASAMLWWRWPHDARMRDSHCSIEGADKQLDFECRCLSRQRRRAGLRACFDRRSAHYRRTNRQWLSILNAVQCHAREARRRSSDSTIHSRST